MNVHDLSTAVPFDKSFESLLGFVYDHLSPVTVAGHFDVHAGLLDRNRTVPSSVFASVAEGAASMGTASAVVSDGMVASGMSNETTWTAGVSNGRIDVRARRRAWTPDLWTWDVEARDPDGRVCAVSKVLIAVRPSR